VRVLVCGGRDFGDCDQIGAVLDLLVRERGLSLVNCRRRARRRHPRRGMGTRHFPFRAMSKSPAETFGNSRIRNLAPVSLQGSRPVYLVLRLARLFVRTELYLQVGP
jgi:hypothetical protein